mgnify:CR=1 FL=1
MNPEENLKKLNINLPKAPDPVGAYVASKIVGNLVFISGQLPVNYEGKLTCSFPKKRSNKLHILWISEDASRLSGIWSSTVGKW